MNNEKKLVVVIPHFEQDIRWVGDLKHPYIIYNKNPEKNHLFEFNLPNVGYDAYAYITYIIDNYDNLPDYVCFAQDNPSYHCINVVELINNFEFDKPFLPLGPVYFLGGHDFEKTYSYASRISLQYSTPLRMIASMQCIVSKELILKTSKETYEIINSTITHSVKSEENYCIENLWPTILNFNDSVEIGLHHCKGYVIPWYMHK